MAVDVAKCLGSSGLVAMDMAGSKGLVTADINGVNY